MYELLKRRRRGQAIVIMALAMVGICGMLALAVDAGRLYFQRRLMQDAVDAGALAGAQDLIGTVANPNGLPSQALYHAQQDTFSVFSLSAIGQPSDSAYQQPSVTQTQGGYTVTTVAPTGYDNKQVQVTVTYSAVATFVQVMGFSQVNIVATATAEAGTNAKSYAIFAYGGLGTGNTIQAQFAGYGQVDNGQDGADACNLSGAGVSISNAKFHIPTSSGILNINGRLIINQGSDNQNMAEFWNTAPAFGTGADPKPDYQAPNTALVTNLNPGQVKVSNIPANGGTATVSGATLHNNTPQARDFIVFFPGQYTVPVVIPRPGDDPGSRYIFLNGVYYFVTGGSLTIAGGAIANTSTGLPHYIGGVGATDLPAAPDGTDGIEFVLDGASSFVAANTALIASSVFFVAPTIVQPGLGSGGGSAHVAFYVASGNTAPLSWTDQNFSAVLSNAPIFQVWGTVFDASASGLGSLYLRAVQNGPHNLTPTDNDPSGQYAINGEFIGYTMTIDLGQIFGSTAGSPPTCIGGVPNWTGHRGTPGLLVQYNKAFAPTPGANSYLIK